MLTKSKAKYNSLKGNIAKEYSERDAEDWVGDQKNVTVYWVELHGLDGSTIGVLGVQIE